MEAIKNTSSFEKIILISGVIVVAGVLATAIGYGIYVQFSSSVKTPDTPDNVSSKSKRRFIVSFPEASYESCVGKGDDPGNSFSMLMFDKSGNVKQGIFAEYVGGIYAPKNPCSSQNTNYFENSDSQVMFENRCGDGFQTLTFQPIDFRPQKEYNLTLDMDTELRHEKSPEMFKKKCERQFQNVKDEEYFENPRKTTYFRMKVSGRALEDKGKFQSSPSKYLELDVSRKELRLVDEKKDSGPQSIQLFRHSESRGLLISYPISKNGSSVPNELNEMKAGKDYIQYAITGDNSKCSSFENCQSNEKYLIIQPKIHEFEPSQSNTMICSRHLGLPNNTDPLRGKDYSHIEGIRKMSEAVGDFHEAHRSEGFVDIEPVVWNTSSGSSNC